MSPAPIRLGFYARRIKRPLGLFIASIALLCAAIPMILIALAIRLTSRGPIFFRQQRVGLRGELFTMYKFRSMKATANPNMTTAEATDMSVITAVGRFIRVTSLDELPQLINVLHGDMAIIGYRPLIPKEVRCHTARRRSGVYSVCRPGITGLAQVNGRDELTDAAKASLDAQYARKITLMGDIRLIYQSVLAVLARDGYKDERDIMADKVADNLAVGKITDSSNTKFYATAATRRNSSPNSVRKNTKTKVVKNGKD
jgi:O-antigen biosynthesis protein WbqP